MSAVPQNAEVKSEYSTWQPTNGTDRYHRCKSQLAPHLANKDDCGHARHHRQGRLLAIECLDLALLIDAEDEGSVRRVKVKADNIAYLVDE
jgi:hypothetical protein